MYVMQSQRPRKTARERPKLRLAAPRRAFARVSLAGPPSRGVKRTTLNRPHVADERSCERYVLAIPQGKRGVHCYNCYNIVSRERAFLYQHTRAYIHINICVYTRVGINSLSGVFGRRRITLFGGARRDEGRPITVGSETVLFSHKRTRAR